MSTQTTTDIVRKHYEYYVKNKAVDEAFNNGATIKDTARKYDVAPSQIRRWNKTINNLPSNLTRKDLQKKKIGCGRKVSFSQECQDFIFNFIKNLCNNDLPLTVPIIVYKLYRSGYKDSTKQSYDTLYMSVSCYLFKK